MLNISVLPDVFALVAHLTRQNLHLDREQSIPPFFTLKDFKNAKIENYLFLKHHFLRFGNNEHQHFSKTCFKFHIKIIFCFIDLWGSHVQNIVNQRCVADGGQCL